MVPAPKYTKAVEVHNKSGETVKVTAHYQDEQKGQTHEEVTAEVLPGSTHLFPEKTIDMGGWQAVAPITSIKAGSHTLKPEVNGVVAQVQVHVQDNGSLQQAH